MDMAKPVLNQVHFTFKKYKRSCEENIIINSHMSPGRHNDGLLQGGE